jgi:hypothetical protein
MPPKVRPLLPPPLLLLLLLLTVHQLRCGG